MCKLRKLDCCSFTSTELIASDIKYYHHKADSISSFSIGGGVGGQSTITGLDWWTGLVNSLKSSVNSLPGMNSNSVVNFEYS